MSGTYSGSDKRLAYLFENGGGGGGSSTLAGLDDVNLSSPTDGQVLKYDATNNEWVNGAGGSGGSDLYLNTIYSETEEKIGYWIDGKPLYQKTVAVTANIPYNEWSSTGVVVDPNADQVITILQARPQSGSSDMHFLAYFGTGGELIVMNMRNVNYGNNYAFYITVQYTKTTDTPEVPQRGNVIYLPTIYSQEEREVGVWEDGKPLYQKTFYVQSSTGSQYPTIADISGLSIDRVVSAVGICTNGDNYKLPLPYSHYEASAYSICLLINNTKTSLEMRIGSRNTSLTDIYCTLQYTKTTDTAGSGSWTPSGAPTVHYSTDEQVVGTWIDGNTLYQKTIYHAGGVAGGLYTIPHNISNLGDVISCTGFCRDSTGDNPHMVIPRIAPDNANIGFTAINETNMLLCYSTLWQARIVDVYITIQYTKSS